MDGKVMILFFSIYAIPPYNIIYECRNIKPQQSCSIRQLTKYTIQSTHYHKLTEC